LFKTEAEAWAFIGFKGKLLTRPLCLMLIFFSGTKKKFYSITKRPIHWHCTDRRQPMQTVS